MPGVDQRKVALVTGASSGIGRATAEAFVARGYATALLDRDADGGRLLETQPPSRACSVLRRCLPTLPPSMAWSV
jgi:NAD(P)-dependent dehydrogenase (short-subunit alcohol dehydrogenase family)